MGFKDRLVGLVGYYDDRFWRYKPVIRFLETLPGPDVLEIGNDGEGITRMWPHPVVGLDIRPNGRFASVSQVLGTAAAMPFRDRAFDVVLAMDVLEHIPPPLRGGAVREMLRVTRGRLFLAFPTGRLAALYERDVNEFYKRQFGNDNPWLIEHIRNGLPDLAGVLQLFDGRKVTVSQNVNLHVWRLYMKMLSLFTRKRSGRLIWDLASLLLVRPLEKVVSRGAGYRVILQVQNDTGGC